MAPAGELSRRRDRHRTENYDLLAELVRRIFTSRRKTLRRALSLGWGRRAADDILARAGIRPMKRVDELTTSDLEAIAAALGSHPG